MKKKVLGLLFISFTLLCLTGCANSEAEKIYSSAIEDFNNKDYLSSMNKYETLDDYKDSKDRYNESVYNLATNLDNLEESYYYFEKIIEYKDSKDKLVSIAAQLSDDYYSKNDALTAIKWIKRANNEDKTNEMMYQYIINHKDNSNVYTYKFLKVLSGKKYKDTEAIYKELYKLSFKLVINVDKDDIKTNLKTYHNSVWKHDDLYAHVIVRGGYPGQKVKLSLKYETLWGLDNEVGPKEQWKKQSNSSIFIEVNKPYSTHTTGIASNLYYHRYTLYDENNNELCQEIIHTPYDK